MSSTNVMGTFREKHSLIKPGKSVTIFIGIALTIGALVPAFPFFWMLTSSVKPEQESVSYPPTVLTLHPTFAYFKELFTQLDFGRYLLNTIAVVLIGFVGLFFVAMAGYAFAKFEFRGK